MRTHYQTLKVAEDAPPEVIKAAYRALSQQHHPDSNPGEQQEEALRSMQAINTAYEALIEPEGRAAYDERLRQERASASALVAPEPPTTPPNHTEGSLVPATEPPTEHRRRRRSSSSRSRSRSEGGELAYSSAESEPLYSSSPRSLAKTDRAMAPLVSSSRSTRVYGRPTSEPGTQRHLAVAGQGQAHPGGGSGRGVRLVWMALFGMVLGLMLLGGLVAWRLGFTGRLWAWYQRHQAEEAGRGLMFGSASDMVPPPTGINEQPYTRPAQTPQGHPWPASTGYLPGTPVLWGDGHCQITVDNTLHDSDVHAKIVAIGPPGGNAASSTTVREAYIQRGTRMRFEKLRPGTYELRYRALLTGQAVRAATVELTQSAAVASSTPAVTTGAAEGTSIMISLYKVAPGNPQRPVIADNEF